MHKGIIASGLAFGLIAGNTMADETCGVGRVAIEFEGIVLIEPEVGECSLLDRKLIVSRYFPTSRFLFDLGADGTCFVGHISGHVTAQGKVIPVQGRSFSAQYAGEAFQTFTIPGTPIRTVFDLGTMQWFGGEANTYIELTKSADKEPFLAAGFDDTFFYTAPTNPDDPSTSKDTEKFVAVSPGVNGSLVAEGPIFWPGADIKGTLCVATTVLR